MRMPAGYKIEEAAAMLEEAERLARLHGDQTMLAWVLAHRGLTNVLRNRAELAAAELDEAEALSRGVGDVDAEARVHIGRGHLAFVQGRLVEADRALAGSMAEIGDRASLWSVERLLNLHGRVILALGESARAEDVLRRAAVIAGRLKDSGGMTYAVTFLAVTAALQSDARRAAVLFGAADRLIERIGVRYQGLYQELSERGRMAARAQVGSATFGSLHEQGQALAFDQVIALATGEASA